MKKYAFAITLLATIYSNAYTFKIKTINLTSNKISSYELTENKTLKLPELYVGWDCRAAKSINASTKDITCTKNTDTLAIAISCDGRKDMETSIGLSNSSQSWMLTIECVP